MFLDNNFDKAVIIFETSTLEFVKNEFSVNTMNCGIGSAFSEGPRSTFSEGSSPLIKHAVQNSNQQEN